MFSAVQLSGVRAVFSHSLKQIMQRGSDIKQRGFVQLYILLYVLHMLKLC